MTLNSSLHVLLDSIHVLGLITYLSFNPDKICWFLIVEVNMDYPPFLTSPVLKKKKDKTSPKLCLFILILFFGVTLSKVLLLNKQSSFSPGMSASWSWQKLTFSSPTCFSLPCTFYSSQIQPFTDLHTSYQPVIFLFSFLRHSPPPL